MFIALNHHAKNSELYSSFDLNGELYSSFLIKLYSSFREGVRPSDTNFPLRQRRRGGNGPKILQRSGHVSGPTVSTLFGRRLSGEHDSAAGWCAKRS